MGVYTYLLNKSKPWTVPGLGKVFNLKYSHRSSDENINKWHREDKEGKRITSLALARNQRSVDNWFPTEYVYFAYDLDDQEVGSIFKVFRGRTDNRDLRVYYDWNDDPGEWVGTVEVLNLKPRKRLRYLPLPPRPVDETEETYICEECNEEKPFSNGSDSSPECDDCWAKNQENEGENL